MNARNADPIRSAARELAAMLGGAGEVSEEATADYAAAAGLDADELWEAVCALAEQAGRDTPRTLTPFTDADWHAWAGCRRYEDDAEPLIGEVGRATLLADRDGLAMFFVHPDDSREVLWESHRMGPGTGTPEERRERAHRLADALAGRPLEEQEGGAA